MKTFMAFSFASIDLVDKQVNPAELMKKCRLKYKMCHSFATHDLLDNFAFCLNYCQH